MTVTVVTVAGRVVKEEVLPFFSCVYSNVYWSTGKREMGSDRGFRKPALSECRAMQAREWLGAGDDLEG